MEKDLCLVAVKGSESFYNKPVFVFFVCFSKEKPVQEVGSPVVS